MASTVLPNGIIIPEKYSRDWYNDLYHNWQELDNLLGGGTPKDGTLTIQKNGSTVGTFSANQATDETINLSVPTKTSDLTNDSGFITGVAWDDVSNKPTFAAVATSGSYDDLSNKPTIPTVNNATLTIQKNGATVNSFTANASSDVTCNITVPTKTSDLSNDSGFITADNTKIPLSGTNALSGSIVPSTDNSYDFGSSSYKLRYVYADTAYVTNLNINGTAAGDILTHNASEFVPRGGGAVISGNMLARTVTNGLLAIDGGTDYTNGAELVLYGKDTYAPNMFELYTYDSTNTTRYQLQGMGDALSWNGLLFQTANLNLKDTYPSISLFNNNASSSTSTIIDTGTATYGSLQVKVWNGSSFTNYDFQPGAFFSESQLSLGLADYLWGQIYSTNSVISTSDRNQKQDINDLENNTLLDAWEDVNLVTYKFKSAVETKGKSARTHVGYVAQDIQEQLAKHNIDASEYGLFCHDSWEEQKEVSHEETYTEEVETKSGEKQTVTKTRKVIDRPYKAKGDSYGLRYTECLVVECKYLRRCIARLTSRIEQLEKGNNTK